MAFKQRFKGQSSTETVYEFRLQARRRFDRCRPVRLRLHGMNHIRKFERVLNEEDRNVVANDVPVTLLGVELDRESPNVAS